MRVRPCESNKILHCQETVSPSGNASPPQHYPLTFFIISPLLLALFKCSVPRSETLASCGQKGPFKFCWSSNLESLEVRLYQNGSESWVSNSQTPPIKTWRPMTHSDRTSQQTHLVKAANFSRTSSFPHLSGGEDGWN